MTPPDLELASSNDNKTVRGTRQTRWSLFYTDRGVGHKYRPKKGSKSSKNICFEASDQFTQAGLIESRKAEWAKWKQFNAVYPVSGPNKSNCWRRDTNQSHSSGSNSTKTSTNGAKMVLMSDSCSKVD